MQWPSKTPRTRTPSHATHPPTLITNRRWREPADWARLTCHVDYSPRRAPILVDVSKFADPATLRPRYATAVKRLVLFDEALLTRRQVGRQRHTVHLPKALASLLRNADLRRSLSFLEIAATCCLPSVARIVTMTAALTGLTGLSLGYDAATHAGRAAPPDNVLAPLSSLRRLRELELAYYGDSVPPYVKLTSWIPLPEIGTLTRVEISAGTFFAPSGSAAALGRVREFKIIRTCDSDHRYPAADDPLYLRAAFDAGKWQPDLMTSLRDLIIEHHDPLSESFYPGLRPRGRAGAEWAALASQITSLRLIYPNSPAPIQTAIAGGLGVLTALRKLDVMSVPMSSNPPHPPVDVSRLRMPHLTHLAVDCVHDTLDAAHTPAIEVLDLLQVAPRGQPVLLRSLAGRTRLSKLVLYGHAQLPPLLNLAELFVDGQPLPALSHLEIGNMVITWFRTGVPGALEGSTFVDRIPDLVPRLNRVGLLSSHVTQMEAMDMMVLMMTSMSHLTVLPALKRLHRGPPLVPPVFTPPSQL